MLVKIAYTHQLKSTLTNANSMPEWIIEVIFKKYGDVVEDFQENLGDIQT